MNDVRTQLPRARRAARRNYLIMCAVAVAVMTALGVAAVVFIL